MVAGVLSGIAKHFNLDLTWLRVGVFFAFLFTAGLVFVAYILAIIVIPSED